MQKKLVSLLIGAAGLAVLAVVAILAIAPLRERAALRALMLTHAVLKHSDHYRRQGTAPYEQHCSSCHGIAGNGGKGPNLHASAQRGARSDMEMLGIIRDGTSGGMPRFGKVLDDRQILHVIAHIHEQHDIVHSTVHGDPRKGQLAFESHGCPACHTVGAVGGTFGPDLTRVGAVRGADYLLVKLKSPEANMQPEYRPMEVQRAGEPPITGLLVSEDTFSVQLRESSGALHSFAKSELAARRIIEDRSLMPTYANVLSPTEIDDLVAFLVERVGS